jgi:hypothetical protein
MRSSTNARRLERRYRHLLALYPKAFRQEQQQEILAVLMAAAREDQRRPRLAESADLVTNAIVMRVRHTKVPTSWEYRHARFVVPARIVIGIWLLFLTAVLYGYGRGGWWGAVLIPAATLHFYIAYRLIHPRQPASDSAPREPR